MGGFPRHVHGCAVSHSIRSGSCCLLVRHSTCSFTSLPSTPEEPHLSLPVQIPIRHTPRKSQHLGADLQSAPRKWCSREGRLSFLGAKENPEAAPFPPPLVCPSFSLDVLTMISSFPAVLWPHSESCFPVTSILCEFPVQGRHWTS